MIAVLRRAATMRAISLAAGLAMLALIPAASAGATGVAGVAGGAAAPVTTTTPPSTATTAPATSGAASTPAGSAPTATSPAGGVRSLSKVPSASGSARHPASAASSKLSTGAILAAVLGGLIALACLVWGAFRWSAVEPRWTLPLRHSVAEAGFRASAVWAEFTDWIRLGH